MNNCDQNQVKPLNCKPFSGTDFKTDSFSVTNLFILYINLPTYIQKSGEKKLHIQRDMNMSYRVLVWPKQPSGSAIYVDFRIFLSLKLKILGLGVSTFFI